MAEYTPSEADVRAWCREGTGDYPDVMDEWITRFLARVRRDAAREALDGLIADKAHTKALLRAENGGNVEDVLTHYRDTHYPEETP